MSRVHPFENRKNSIEDDQLLDSSTSSLAIRDNSSIIRPTRQKSFIREIYPVEDPHIIGGSYLVNFEEELARLELETLDDFVYDALGSYEINPSENSDTIQSVENFGPREKYTVRSAKVRDSAEYHRHVRKGRRINNDEEPTCSSALRNNGDSGISSANTPPNVYLIDQQFYSSEEPGEEFDMGNPDRKKLEKNPSKTQINGSVGGGNGNTTKGTTPATTSSHRHPKPKSLPSQQSFYTQTDANILRADLIAAVEQNKVDRVRRILNSGNGVDPNSVCDEKGRWPLHLACLLGHSSIAQLLLDHGSQKDQPDTTLERTPLMYAAATSKDATQVLLSVRADLSARNRFGASALHYSAGAGQAECCRLLLSAGCDVNGRDKNKMTPLLMAARVNDIWSIEILLEYGADINALDMFGKSALHHAAETCNESKEADAGKMGATFRKLVSSGVKVDGIDSNGKSALSYAIQTGSAEAVTILYELGAELLDGMSLLTMSRKFPTLISNFLDKCVSSNIDNCDPESKQFYIQFDYTCLTFFPKDIPNDKLLSIQNRDETESILQEMGVLHGLTKCSDSSILSHPVCESLLRLKWKKVKWYLYLDMLLFAVFLAFLTAVIFMEYESDTPIVDPSVNITESEHDIIYKEAPTHHPMGHERYCMDSSRNIVVWSILWVLTAFLFIREMVQLIQSPLHYVVQVDNMLELVLVSSVALLSLAECGVQSFVEARDHFAAVCLIVGWTIQVTLYGKIPIFGVYIRMFAAVAVNILKCMFTYLGLLFAFSLTLHFLFRTQKDFDSVGFTFLKTFAMMIGEIDLARTFIDSKSKNAVIVPFTSHLVVALFIIFISIILSSLFVALAVCDISSMQREGEYMQLVQQVKVSSQLEDALQKRSLLYPQFGMRDIRSLRQRKGVIFPNLKDHGKLSKDALEIVMTQHTKKLDPSRTTLAHPAHPDYDQNINKATNEIADDLFQRVKDGMDKYSDDVNKKVVQMVQDIKSNDRSSSGSLTREVLLIKSQLEDMNTCLREMSLILNNLSDKSSFIEMSSPKHSRKKSSRAASRSPGVGSFNNNIPTEENQHSASSEVQPEVVSIEAGTGTPVDIDTTTPSVDTTGQGVHTTDGTSIINQPLAMDNPNENISVISNENLTSSPEECVEGSQPVQIKKNRKR